MGGSAAPTCEASDVDPRSWALARRLLKSVPMKRLAFVSLLAACGTSAGDSPWGDGTGTPDSPVPSDNGPYQVATTIDLTIEAVLPAQAELVVATLRDFSTNPAHALVTIADKAGVPAVAAIYGVLPGVLKDKLEGWINDEIAKVKIAGKPVTDYAAEIAALADTALSEFAIDSELALAPEAATHRLTAIDFNPAGFDVVLPIPGLAGDILTQTPTVVVAEGGALTLGDQHFGLNYGEYAWQGINLASKATFGGDVRTTLGKALNCPNLAHAIASKCVLTVCVGHETDLTNLCEGGLDALVGAVHDQLAAMRFDVLHFQQGTGHLTDDDQDGIADRITGGTWTAELNLGMGLRHAPATFAATR